MYVYILLKKSYLYYFPVQIFLWRLNKIHHVIYHVSCHSIPYKMIHMVKISFLASGRLRSFCVRGVIFKNCSCTQFPYDSIVQKCSASFHTFVKLYSRIRDWCWGLYWWSLLEGFKGMSSDFSQTCATLEREGRVEHGPTGQFYWQ